MALTTEQRAKIERGLDSVLSKVSVALLIAGWLALSTWLTKDQIGRLSLIGSGVLSLLLAKLGLVYLRVRRDRDTLTVELATADKAPGEPTLTQWQDTVVCHAWDYWPFGMEPHEIVEEFPMNDDNFGDAMESLVKWDYLSFDDGRGSMGEGNGIETYKITKKGRRYVEAKWPDRGDSRRKKMYRQIRRRANQAAKLHRPRSN